MHFEIKRTKPVKPPIEKVIIELSQEEAKELYTIIRYAFIHDASAMFAANETSAGICGNRRLSLQELLLENLKEVY